MAAAVLMLKERCGISIGSTWQRDTLNNPNLDRQFYKH